MEWKGELFMRDKRYCLYARTAQMNQLELDSQAERLKSFARKHELNVVHCALELGSAHNYKRLALNQVMELADNHEIDIILITDSARIYRDIAKYIDFVGKMKSLGIKILTLDDIKIAL